MKMLIIERMILPILKIISRCLWHLKIILSIRQWVFVITMTCLFLLHGQRSQAQIYVDACGKNFFEDGTMLFPYKTLAKAVEHAKAFPGSSIIMKGGVYAETLTISETLTITAYDGNALIGRYNVGWRDVILELSSGQSTIARIYYPSWIPGPNTQIASSCEGAFPAVVYAHGRRTESFDICACWNPGPLNEDYKQAEGILTRLASSGIVAISFNWYSLTILDHKVAEYIIDAITHLGNEFGGGVNLQKIGLIGHSTGGAAVIRAVEMINNWREPPMVALGLIAPAFPSAGLNLSDPVLVINGTNEHPCQVGLQPLEIYCEAAPPKHLVFVTGANHFGYTEDICLDPGQVRGGECLFDLYGLDPRDFLPYSPGWDNNSEVGGETGQKAQALQQLAAGNYLLAFFSYYLQNDTNAIDYLIQQEGKHCGYPGSPESCAADLMISPPSDSVPVRYFESLQSSNVKVNVCSCLR